TTAPHSFPTRRSSDLVAAAKNIESVVQDVKAQLDFVLVDPAARDTVFGDPGLESRELVDRLADRPDRVVAANLAQRLLAVGDGRSEEHTSELQSPDHL